MDKYPEDFHFTIELALINSMLGRHDVAMETADVTLISGDLRGVPRSIYLSQRTVRGIKENLFWAFGYNVSLIPTSPRSRFQTPRKKVLLTWCASWR